MRLFTVFLTLVSVILASQLASAQVPPQSDPAKKLVLDYLENVMAQKQPDLAGDYMVEGLIQHGVRAKDGLAGIKTYLKVQPGGKNPMVIVPYRMVKDGDLIAVQTNLINSGRNHNYMHMFRVEGEKIIEYWEAEANIGPVGPDSSETFVGPHKILDLDKTAQNRALVSEFIQTVYGAGSLEKISQFVAPDMIQHDARIEDGAAGLHAYLQKFQDRGINFSYQSHPHILAEGNFVVVLSESLVLSQAYAAYDIFRISDGKIAEQWNVNEAVPRRMRHDNGMF